jgi:hypothetical protein
MTTQETQTPTRTVEPSPTGAPAHTRSDGGGSALRRRASLLFALSLPAASVVALAAHAWNAARVPSRAEWRAAADAVRADWREGDVVAFVPGWAQEGRGDFAGLQAIADEAWDAEHVSAHRRVHVVASFGARAPAWLQAEAKEEGAPRRFGGLVLTSWARSQADARWDFVAHAAEAEVTLTPATGPAQSCTRQGARFDCSERGRYGWRWVGEHRMIAGGRARRCLWAHPTTGATLRIRFPSVPLGRTLRVSHGLADSVAHGGAPVSMDVAVADARVGTVAQQVARGWSQTAFDTTAQAGQRAAVTFEVRTPSDGSRHFCFAAEVLP